MKRPALALPAVVLAALACLTVLSGAVPTDNPPPPRLDLVDLEGRPTDPLGGPGSVKVFVFTRTDCPISNRYAPTLRRLHEAFAQRGVGFWLVYPDPDETAEAIHRHVTDYGYPIPALRDPHHTFVKRTGVRVTPEAVVFDSGRIAYRGRIDDRVVEFGQVRPEPTTHDLQSALDSVLEGRPVANPTTPAVGCFIAPLQ